MEIKFTTKIKVLLWLTIREVLSTCEFLNARRLEITNTCYLRNQSRKNIDHILKFCPFAQGVLDHIKCNCQTHIIFFPDLNWFIKTILPNVKFSNN